MTRRVNPWIRRYTISGCDVRVIKGGQVRLVLIDGLLVGHIERYAKLYRAPDGFLGDRLGETVAGYVERWKSKHDNIYSDRQQGGDTRDHRPLHALVGTAGALSSVHSDRRNEAGRAAHGAARARGRVRKLPGVVRRDRSTQSGGVQ